MIICVTRELAGGVGGGGDDGGGDDGGGAGGREAGKSADSSGCARFKAWNTEWRYRYDGRFGLDHEDSREKKIARKTDANHTSSEISMKFGYIFLLLSVLFTYWNNFL